MQNNIFGVLLSILSFQEIINCVLKNISAVLLPNNCKNYSGK